MLHHFLLGIVRQQLYLTKLFVTTGIKRFYLRINSTVLVHQDYIIYNTSNINLAASLNVE